MKFDKEIKVITEFKSALQRYIALDYEDKEDSSLREKLNTLAGRVCDYVEEAGVSTGFSINQTYVPVFYNLCNISNDDLRSVIDLLDQAIGNYKHNQDEFKRKRFNPIYWIGEFVRIPFYLIAFAGFDINKIELSFLGKMYKCIGYFIIYLAALATILATLILILHDYNIYLSDIF